MLQPKPATRAAVLKTLAPAVIQLAAAGVTVFFPMKVTVSEISLLMVL